MTRSSALAGTERVRHTAPDWARAEIPAHRRPLPVITAEALTQPGVDLTRERLSALAVQRATGEWSPWAADLRERGAAIRRETLRDLEGYLRRLTDALERHGAVVHRVSTPAQARDAVARVARDNGVRLVAKAKSMATEEIRLTEHLNGLGIDVVETDLGEYIVQAAGERPSHIVGPALHKSRQDVTDLFSTVSGSPMSQDPDVLAAFARERLRADFKAADMGICGVNFAAADTGTLVIVTNEGNADMVTSQPDIVVAVMPVEKVIPRFGDLGVLVPLLCDTANKQFVTAYQTLLNGPRRQGETDGPSQLHVVIFDNGRTAVLGTPKEEVLACIRCGNCQFACPVFRTLGGGHAYGTVYGGPIGAILSPIIGDPDTDADLPFLSSLCGACADACPVKIPIPELLLTLRAEYAGRHTGAEALGWRGWGRLWGNARTYRATVRAAALVGRVVPGGWLARLPGPAGAWARGRLDAPAVAGRHGSADDAARTPPPGRDPAMTLQQFTDAAMAAGARVVHVGSSDEAREVVMQQTAGGSVLRDEIPMLDGLDLGEPPPDPWDATVGVSEALCGAAESGTVALVQQRGSPRRTSLLPARHIVLLDVARIHATYQELIDEVGSLAPPPTGVQLVTGPSRSGDIESAMIHGMHGPREVLVVLVG